MIVQKDVLLMFQCFNEDKIISDRLCFKFYNQALEKSCRYFFLFKFLYTVRVLLSPNLLDPYKKIHSDIWRKIFPKMKWWPDTLPTV